MFDPPGTVIFYHQRVDFGNMKNIKIQIKIY